jgi:hypothetical protein
MNIYHAWCDLKEGVSDIAFMSRADDIVDITLRRGNQPASRSRSQPSCAPWRRQAAKARAKAVILPDGTISEGWIGGGCARAAVLKAAKDALANGRSRLVSVQPPDVLADRGFGHLHAVTAWLLPAVSAEPGAGVHGRFAASGTWYRRLCRAHGRLPRLARVLFGWPVVIPGAAFQRGLFLSAVPRGGGHCNLFGVSPLQGFGGDSRCGHRSGNREAVSWEHDNCNSQTLGPKKAPSRLHAPQARG